MNKDDLPPAWAIQEVIRRYKEADRALDSSVERVLAYPRLHIRTLEFARYIAAHEQPPIDSNLIAAREWAHSYAADHPEIDQFGWLEGNLDGRMAVKAFLAGAVYGRDERKD